MKYKIDCFLEDGATVYEVKDDQGKIVDRMYIGETTWEYNRQQALDERKAFFDKYNVEVK